MTSTRSVGTLLVAWVLTLACAAASLRAEEREPTRNAGQHNRSSILLQTAQAIGQAVAGEQEPRLGERVEVSEPNDRWADEMVRHNWRVQRDVASGRYRLLDARDHLQAAGDFAHCQGRLEALQREAELPPVQGDVVLLVHGLFRSHRAGIGMQRFLAKHNYAVERVGYPSTRGSLSEHAAGLRKVVAHLPQAERIFFVAHSMGNLVIRQYLAEEQQRAEVDPRLGRIVMLGPPNQGAWIADQFDGMIELLGLGKVVVRQVSDQWEQTNRQLGTPPLEFGIVAGYTAEGSEGNPFLPGRDDLVVRVAETRLEGARDFLELPVVHMQMFATPAVQEHTLRFLRHGYFVAAEARRPLPLQNAEMAAE